MKREGMVIDDVEAFTEAGRRLRELDPDNYRRILALCRAFVANAERELESGDVWQSRLMEISTDTPRGSA